ncbi:MAG: DUF6702 family protein [Pseudomonadota bacterium]
MIQRIILMITLILALPMAAPVAAHQQKITLSSVSHNARTGLLEVVHRVPLHDAEHALEAQGVRAPDIVNDLKSRRAVAKYVADRFSLTHNGQPVPLTLLGTEIEGGRLIVYQEAASPGSGAQLSINSQILTDVFERQENRVNLGAGTKVATLVFSSGDRARIARLP